MMTGNRVPLDKEPVLVDEAPCGETDDETELPQIADSFEDIVNCLLHLSVTIRNPAPHHRYKLSSSTDASHFEPFDIAHVRSRFPGTSDALAKRLGVANSQRRQCFHYRKLHHEKLFRGIDFDKAQAEAGVESTVASSIPKDMQNHVEANESSYLDEDTYSAGGASHTSYASSTADMGAENSTAPKGVWGRAVRVPILFHDDLCYHDKSLEV
jgi:hypothetical protein